MSFKSGFESIERERVAV